LPEIGVGKELLNPEGLKIAAADRERE